MQVIENKRTTKELIIYLKSSTKESYWTNQWDRVEIDNNYIIVTLSEECGIDKEIFPKEEITKIQIWEQNKQ